MDADRRGWDGGALVFALLGVLLATPVSSEEFKSQLGDDIARRFAEPSFAIDDAPIEFGCEFSKHIASRVRIPGMLLGVNYWMATPREGARRLEEPATLPQATLVETYIAKGFPSGESTRSIRDDSYHLAVKQFSFGGIGFSR